MNRQNELDQLEELGQLVDEYSEMVQARKREFDEVMRGEAGVKEE